MPEKKEDIKPQDPLLKAKSDALRLLSFRPRSVDEMRRRLRLKRYGPGLVDQVIEVLSRQGLLDDEKFAKLYSQSRLFTRPSGKRQIEFELKRKGVPKEVVARTMEGLEGYDEKRAAVDLVRLRMAKMTGVSAQKKKARVFGFLKRRGFSNSAIFSVFDELFKDTAHLD